MNLIDAKDRSALAGEYVLGTLTGADREAFEAALASDADLKAQVYQWQDKLLTLALRVPAVTPQAQTWQQIESRLTSAPNATPIAAPGSASPRPAAAIGRAVSDDRRARRQLRWWQGLAGFAVAACVVLATLLTLRTAAPPASADRYLTVLQADDKSPGWLVEVTAGRSLRLVPIGPSIEVPQGKSLQFWTKLDSDPGPTSLGLVAPGQTVELALDKLPGVAENQLFELTLEPAAGSPLDRPTGPIVYIGRSVRL